MNRIIMDFETFTKLEQYLLGRMPVDEALAWENELAQMEEADQKEVELYGQLISGLTNLGTKNILQQFEIWERDAAVHDDAERIEWYFQNDLHVDARQSLEARQASDPAIAHNMKAQGQLYAGMAALRSEQMRTKMTEWEKKATSTEPTHALNSKKSPQIISFRKRIQAIAAAITLLIAIGVGLKYYAASEYSNERIIQKYSVAPFTGTLQGNDQPTNDQARLYAKFDRAYDDLIKQNYTSAINNFEQVLSDIPTVMPPTQRRNNMQQSGEWNLILAQLARGDAPSTWRSALEKIAANNNHIYHDKALELIKRLDSSWRLLVVKN